MKIEGIMTKKFITISGHKREGGCECGFCSESPGYAHDYIYYQVHVTHGDMVMAASHG